VMNQTPTDSLQKSDQIIIQRHSLLKKEEYKNVLDEEITKLEQFIFYKPLSFEVNCFLISPVGSGLANKHSIWKMIEPRLKELKKYSSICRIVFLWEEDI